MTEYTLEITDTTIALHPGKLKNARSFLYAPGLTFWKRGIIGKRREIAVNVCINKAIEHGLRAVQVKWADYA